MTNAISSVTIDVLQAFADAWNRHDVDALMSFMTDDCVFESSAGSDVCGTRYAGRDAVRAGFAEVWTVFPDAHWGDARHFVQGDQGVSEWTFTGTRADGSRVEVHGCDLFAFRDGKIALKNSYRKNRPPLIATNRRDTMDEMPAANDLDQLTETSVALLAQANDVAARLRHEYIGTEHIVLALTARDAGVATAALEHAGVDPRAVNLAITGIVTSGQVLREPPSVLNRPFTSRTHQSFAFAAESARQMGAARIAPEHLLLGILRERMNIGAQVLGAHGLTIEKATQAIEQVRNYPAG